MRILTIIFLVLAVKMLQAQPYYFKHYQVENGLSNNSIFSSIQDHNGFMWFGTKDGLNRFDGYSFKTYRHDDTDPKSLGSDKIHSLLNDKNNLLWVGTDEGLYQYNAIEENFEPVQVTRNMPISYLRCDDLNNLWILSDSKVYVYNPARKTLQAAAMEQPFPVTYLYIRSNGQILATSPQSGIAIYNPKQQRFEIRYTMDQKNPSGLGWISVVAETNDQQLVIGTTTQGIKLFDLKTNTLKTLLTLNRDKTHIYVRDIKTADGKTFWIGTESGLYIYNNENGQTDHLQKQYTNPYSLSDNAIYNLCIDREGGVWMGTYFGGINYYSPKSSVFTKYFPRQHDNSISGTAVREICKDQNGNYWIGTEDAGLNKLDPETGLFTTYFPNGKKHSIAHSNIHGLLADGNKLWISTFEHGLDIMDINTGLIIKHYHAGKGNSLKSNFILNLYKTKSGHILVATTIGLYIYNSLTDDFDAVPGLPVLFFNNIFEDSEGRIWAGTYNDGLFNFRLGDKNYKRFQYNAKNKRTIGNNTINCIFEDSRKNIWVSTDGGGLALFNKQTLDFTSYTVKHGLPSNFLFRILEDRFYKFWISSTRGLIKFDPVRKTSKTYTRADGLLSDQFNYNSSYKDTDGRMFFGSVKGLISFLPEQLHTTATTAPVFLTGFQIDNAENQGKKNSLILPSKGFPYTSKITLNYNQSSFSIDFAALSYISPETTEYAYKMKGLYSNWEYLKTNRKVYFTKLEPGAYVFEVKSMINGSNSWSKNNLLLHITILPPFWKTQFAYLLYFLILVGFIFILVREYHKRTQRKNKRRMEIFEHKKEKEIYQAKIEFFTNVAHEIRTPLTLIKGPMEKLLKHPKDDPSIDKNLKIMDRNTQRLLDLTNQLLDFRKTEVHGFSLNFVKANISEVLRDLAMQFQFAAEQKNISYETLLPDSPVYAYVDLEAFYKIMSNLVDNALKYGESEVKVILETNETEDNFKVYIMNDGVRISQDIKHKIFEPFYRAIETEMKQGTGIGLSISKSLTELHNGHLDLENGNPDYNIFVAQFPIHQTIGFNLNGKWKKI